MSGFAVFVRLTPKLLWAVLSALVCWTSGDARSQQTAATIQVAAVQFASGDARRIDARCAKSDANCAIEALVRRAAQKGASLVVAPEYGLAQRFAEPSPKLGDTPRRAPGAPLLSRFASLSRELGIYLVIQLNTKQGDKLHSTQVALDPDGRVVGVHYKFELYGAERFSHAAGDDVMAFDTPFGRVGMLICADLYGDPRLHDKLSHELDVHIVALSSMWTVPRATRWQAAFARDWSVYVVAANSTGGKGHGGGVFDPRGRGVSVSETGEPTVTIASIPVQL
jgi:predicted amidohydrolase